jgi:hypothetical protein
VAGAPAAPPRVDFVFTAECIAPFDWMAAGMFESFDALYGADGDGGRVRITRLLACSEAQLAAYNQTAGWRLGRTFVHRNYKHNPHNGDDSGSYNKPGSIMHWAADASASGDAEYVVFLDSDMVLRKRIEPLELGAARGVVASARVDYLIGCRNGLARRFLPAQTEWKLVQPAGWVHVFHAEDVRRIAPRWLHWTEQVRSRPEEYWAASMAAARAELTGGNATSGGGGGGGGPSEPLADIPTGDAYARPGTVPWISEMYGYAFAAAEAQVAHVFPPSLVGYPSDGGRDRERAPAVLHYGVDFKVGGALYAWNKMSFGRFDPGLCPRGGRFFAPPPSEAYARARGARGWSGSDEQGAIVVETLNAGLCGYYARLCGEPAARLRCPPARRERAPTPPCAAVGAGAAAAGAACCEDADELCWAWALAAECEANPQFMHDKCARSCGRCPEPAPEPDEPRAARDGSANATGAGGGERAPPSNLDTLRTRALALGVPGLGARSELAALESHFAVAVAAGLVASASCALVVVGLVLSRRQAAARAKSRRRNVVGRTGNVARDMAAQRSSGVGAIV